MESNIDLLQDISVDQEYDGARESQGGETVHTESETEYNTADLSDLSGLSKILKADDSIADRVRYLLEDENGMDENEKPALLNSGHEHKPANEEFKEKMLTLLKDTETPVLPEYVKRDSSDVDSKISLVSEKLTSPEEDNIPEEEIISQEEFPVILSQESINDVQFDPHVSTPPEAFQEMHRHLGDGADEDVVQGKRYSSDDIMNISDSTEYSDLPKVVDNPIKSSSTTKIQQPLTNPPLAKIPSNSSNSSLGPMARITGNARYYADSDPNTPQFSEDQEKLLRLEKYVQRKIKDPISSGNVPIHSTPAPQRDVRNISLPSIEADKIQDETPKHESAPIHNNREVPEKSIIDRRRSHESNITLRSRNSNGTGRSNSLHSAPNSSISRDHPLPASLEDKVLLDKVKTTVLGEESGNRISLKGPHTSSAHSIASTVDSLAMQVKNLLREESVQQQQIIEGDLSDINVNEISHASNFSDEITNFEKTSLWKYTRQFLPGAMTPSKEIRSLEKFNQSSGTSIPLVEALDSSDAESDVYCPDNVSMNAQYSDVPKTSKLSHSVNTPSFHAMPREPVSESRISSVSMPRHAKSLESPQVPIRDLSTHRSHIVGRYDSYPKDCDTTKTPQNESYKQLVPEYSQTPYTPYSFVTPRKVVWETPKEFNTVKFKSPIPKQRQIPKRTSTADPTLNGATSSEESAYFNNRQRSRPDLPLMNDRNIPLYRRPQASEFIQTYPDHTNSPRMYRTPALYRSETPTRDVPSTSEDDIVVKPFTPPSRLERMPRELDKYSARSNSPLMEYSARKMYRTPSPKSVHFKDPERIESRSLITASNRIHEPTLPLSTPKVSHHKSPKNITPKVVKERPRTPKALPTFDQLVAEQEKQGKDLEDKELPPSPTVQVNSNAGPSILKHDSFTKNEDDLKFSSLKPEICYDDSEQEESLHQETTTPPKSKQNKENNKTCFSDAEMQRRTTFTDSCDSEVERPRSARSLDPSLLISQAGVSSSSKVSITDSSQPNSNDRSDTSSPVAPIEPAPLPYVRLGKKKPTMPLRRSTPLRSMSTEKVQSLLKKERNAGRKPSRSRSVGKSGRATTEWSSSDEDLINLLETFSTKVPLIEKLLQKLYEKNLQKSAGFEHPETPSTDEQDLTDRYMQTSHHDEENTPVPKMISTNPKPTGYYKSPYIEDLDTVDQCIQTSHIHDGNTPVLKPLSTNIPMRRPTHQEKVFAESSSQTSFFKPHATKMAPEKRVKNVEKPGEKNDIVMKSKNEDNKENNGGSKTPCAFFVDLTPEKLPKPAPEDKPRGSPVAWYEPYEYMPPWRRPDKSDQPKLGFVDANIQDAFLNKKRSFVIRSWERQEDIAIRAEERKLKELEMKIHDQIVALHREKALPRPVTATSPRTKEKPERVFGWKEMRVSSKQKYEALPEVVARKKEAERKKYYELNRKRALQYKRKITQSVVQKQKNKAPTVAR